MKTKMKKLLMTGVVALAVLALAPAAKADTVVTLTTTAANSCNATPAGGCPVATYTVTIHPTGGSNYTVTLAISNISGVVASSTDKITSVNTKFASDLTGVSNSSLTGGTNIGAVTWTTNESNISNADCATPGQGFVCSQASGTGLPIANGGGPYTWVWNVTTSGALTSTVHIGVNYDPANGKILSYKVPVSVLEPGTLTLLGSGLLGLAALRRRLL